MYHSAKCITGCWVSAPDGDVGKVYDLYFDDQQFGARYLSVEAGTWMTGKCVWVSPDAVEEVDWDQKIIYVNFTKENVAHSEDVDLNKPIEVQQSDDEQRRTTWPVYRVFPMSSGYFGPAYPYNYPGPVVLGLVPGRLDVAPVLGETETATEAPPAENHGDVHLRSVQRTDNYKVLAEDGHVGNVVDFLVNDRTWALSYIVMDAGGWLSNKIMLLPMELVSEVNWQEEAISICAFKDKICSSPEYDDKVPLTREYESKLYEHYGRPKHWE